MKQIGNRIIYDDKGNILLQTGEMEGNILDRTPIEKIDYVDLEFGSIDYNTYMIVGINTENKTPILEKIIKNPTENELKIQELEKQNADLSYSIMMNMEGN